MPENKDSSSIKVKVFADLRKLAEAESDFKTETPVTVGKILKTLGIPEQKVTVIFINGRHGEVGDSVSPGDILSLFPPVGGG